jgi:hypothetical protein
MNRDDIIQDLVLGIQELKQDDKDKYDQEISNLWVQAHNRLSGFNEVGVQTHKGYSLDPIESNKKGE